jgi:hypothetical protein
MEVTNRQDLARQWDRLVAAARLLSGVLSVALLGFSLARTSRAALPAPGLTPTAFSYLPFVARSQLSCPSTSTNQYQNGIAYQYDRDNPVRPAQAHADKNIELRGFAVTEPDVRDFIDYGCDDDTRPPQFATLFGPARVPALTTFYRVHHWVWSDSPEPGERGDPIAHPPVTALGLQTIPGEALRVPTSGYDIGGGMEVILLFADADTVALRYTREDSSGPPGYTVHLDGLCTDPNLLALYIELDDPDGPRYQYPNAAYQLPTLYAGQPVGVARGTQVVVAIADTGTFQDPRSLEEWWQVRPGSLGGHDDAQPALLTMGR